ncbi:transglycosylase family protein [Arthrobacter zhangbolii]|uniref:Transglycosylase family protein n=1 Tax=Arthrobacter zhangbolii TaxID=2886936 RepID=A0A9X1S9B7_9MICC|nr:MULTISPECIES: transglycosylase family protein [Arthrobacter]MCC3272082.1 transglycosylase family protein [Arthrobacter zhangbolii]MCC3294436.1 transglycosylase family protein [Arthrobacter zhangbolii]MDN3903142.1 transglycosylase family protein [Arthrobacter sp. YD2]UON92043.1 transglycosylase family protein [Arthrobacter zhangbolii]
MKNQKIRRIVRRGLATAALTGVGAAGLAGLAAPANASSMDWDALAQCESGGNWATNTGNGFSGGLQFTPSTWAAFGGTGDPANASREQQIAVAERVLAEQGPGAWPACTAKLGLTGATANPQAATPAPATTPVETQAPAQTYAPVETAPVEAAPAPTYVEPQALPEQLPAPTNVEVQAVAPVQAPAPALSGETYVIQAGDTLSTIAEKLGIEGGWQALYNANADTVIHQDLIFTGQTLQLPA